MTEHTLASIEAEVAWTPIEAKLKWDVGLQETIESIMHAVAQLKRGEGRLFEDKDLPVDDDD